MEDGNSMKQIEVAELEKKKEEGKTTRNFFNTTQKSITNRE